MRFVMALLLIGGVAFAGVYAFSLAAVTDETAVKQDIHEQAAAEWEGIPADRPEHDVFGPDWELKECVATDPNCDQWEAASPMTRLMTFFGQAGLALAAVFLLHHGWCIATGKRPWWS